EQHGVREPVVPVRPVLTEVREREHRPPRERTQGPRLEAESPPRWHWEPAHNEIRTPPHSREHLVALRRPEIDDNRLLVGVQELVGAAALEPRLVGEKRALPSARVAAGALDLDHARAEIARSLVV